MTYVLEDFANVQMCKWRIKVLQIDVTKLLCMRDINNGVLKKKNHRGRWVEILKGVTFKSNPTLAIEIP